MQRSNQACLFALRSAHSGQVCRLQSSTSGLVFTAGLETWCDYVLFTRAGDGDGVQGPDTAQCAGAYLLCAVSSDCTHKERLRSVLELRGLAVVCSVHVLERAISSDHTKRVGMCAGNGGVL
jgi:hypothetical protein